VKIAEAKILIVESFDLSFPRAVRQAQQTRERRRAGFDLRPGLSGG
jgi:hypothetical protein